MTDATTESQIQRLVDVLHGRLGGPRGLVYAVEDLVEAVARHDRALFGKNGSPGLVDQVRSQTEVLNELKSGYTWLVRLLAGQLVLFVAGLGWWVFLQVAGGG